MLLPSPLPSEPFLPPPQPTRPALKSTGAYRAGSQPQFTTSTILASCRALQNLLNTTPALSCQSKSTQTHEERRTQTRTCVPLHLSTHSSTSRKSSQPAPTPPRGTKKRRRDDYEADEKSGLHSPDLDQENYGYSTPKRQRRIPLSMPLGLCAADFRSLDEPEPTTLDVSQLNMPLSPSTPLTPGTSTTSTPGTSTATSWTAADDRALVSTVLEKLQLSRYEWNDCARILGKDKDTLGRRWRMLVGDGDVGLRRGGARRGRVGLDVGSW